jgi:hypothetical protein
MNKTRPKQLSFRVSEEEYRQLQEKILESGKNQQEYILSCVLEKQIVNTDGIKELIPELKRIGNNLNQIAKRCNEGECCRVKRTDSRFPLRHYSQQKRVSRVNAAVYDRP